MKNRLQFTHVSNKLQEREKILNILRKKYYLSILCTIVEKLIIISCEYSFLKVIRRNPQPNDEV